jgi:hypothetical protein
MHMSHMNFSDKDRRIGVYSTLAVFILLVIYAITTTLGFLSLKSPLEPIGDPYFSLMELLIIILSPLLVVVMASVHAYASPDDKTYSLLGLVFMSLMAVITCSEHFVVLTVSRQIQSISGLSWLPLFFSFRWPSVIYALDILAWDIFFPVSVLFAALVFKGGRLETSVRILMLASGILSLAGLLGVPLGDMNVRNIGIIGYAGLSPIWVLLLAIIFRRTKPFSKSSKQGSAT